MLRQGGYPNFRRPQDSGNQIKGMAQMRKNTWVILTVLAASALCFAAQARVTRVVVEDTRSPAFDGRSFGAAGRKRSRPGA
jgi:archaeosine-15-forming tRNA-guanine transglycosylase